jgi:hypothetical protein
LTTVLPTSTPTQDGPAATKPTKFYVPSASASTETNIQQLISVSTGVYVPASASTEANIQQQLVST